jgi:hypothetical protein
METNNRNMKGRYSSNLKFIIAVVLIFISCHNAFSQKEKNYTDSSRPATVLFGTSAMSFSISPYLANKAKTQFLSGNYPLKTLYMPGFEAGINYHVHLNKNYSIIFGLHGGAAARNFKLFISKTDFNPNLNFDVNEDGQLTGEYDFYASMPVWVEKRWFKTNNSFWSVAVGINVRFYPIRYQRDLLLLSYQNVNQDQIEVLEINALIGNNLRPWLNYNLGGGYAFLLRNNNYLQAELVANLSGKKVVNGSYSINVSGKPQSSGKYSANLSYVGLSFSYIFTGANKRLRKLYEEKIKPEY